MGWVHHTTFSSEIAVLVAQISPVLLIAFIVEVRAIGTRREINGRDSIGLLWGNFVTFALLVGCCLAYVNGQAQLTGPAALLAWALIGSLLAVQVFWVGVAAWAALAVATSDAKENETRTARLDDLSTRAGWRWFVFGQQERRSKPN